MRVLPRSPAARAVPGDRLRLREACIVARMAGGKVHATSLARAEFAIFPDGWRQYRDGRREHGRPPTDPHHQWVGAMHMPEWASRATLLVEWSRTERLTQIAPADIRAEGVRPLLGGLLWRWPHPIPDIHRSAARAFAQYWDVHHSGAGERWADDPEVVVLGFRAVRVDARVGN